MLFVAGSMLFWEKIVFLAEVFLSNFSNFEFVINFVSLRMIFFSYYEFSGSSLGLFLNDLSQRTEFWGLLTNCASFDLLGSRIYIL